MYYVIGLGNPGEEYAITRHNIGRMAVKLLAEACGGNWKNDSVLKAEKSKVSIAGSSATLLLPNTFMNKSGAAIAPLIMDQKITSLKGPEFKKAIEKKTSKIIVVQDDLDMPLGKIKIVFNRGSGGHRGVDSIKRALKTEAFVRIKIGILQETPQGKIKKPSGEDKVVKFILGQFQPDELKKIKKILAQVPEMVDSIVTEGYLEAMNKFNAS